MQGHQNHHNHGHEDHKSHSAPESTSRMGLATSATLHCLLGCGIGEVTGMVIGIALALSNLKTILLAIVLGFVFGFALGVIPLFRAGFSAARASRQVFIAESLSIAVMETAEVLVQVYTPASWRRGFRARCSGGGCCFRWWQGSWPPSLLTTTS